LNQYVVNAAHQEGEEANADELYTHLESVLNIGSPHYISIANSCEGSDDEIDRVDIYLCFVTIHNLLIAELPVVQRVTMEPALLSYYANVSPSAS
jgi:hypothetical protein